jgi:serine/threonine-protein kinase HipA
MADEIEVHIDFAPGLRRIGTLCRHARRGEEGTTFEYDATWLISNVDDHLRNHGFLWEGPSGWTLSPAYDPNPTPADVRPRILTTHIDLDDGTCDLDLVQSVAELFSLSLETARAVIKEVATATATWRDVAAEAGARRAEISRMRSAFEHRDLQRALSL